MKKEQKNEQFWNSENIYRGSPNLEQGYSSFDLFYILVI